MKRNKFEALPLQRQKFSFPYYNCNYREYSYGISSRTNPPPALELTKPNHSYTTWTDTLLLAVSDVAKFRFFLYICVPYIAYLTILSVPKYIRTYRRLSENAQPKPVLVEHSAFVPPSGQRKNYSPGRIPSTVAWRSTFFFFLCGIVFQLTQILLFSFGF